MRTQESKNLFSLTSERQPIGPCFYCNGNHWNDMCAKYQTAEERKQRLKWRCYICLLTGHRAFECFTRKKACFYCGKINHHHRSLCPQKFRAFELKHAQFTNLKEETQQFTSDSQVPENKEPAPKQPETEIYWVRNNLEWENALWQQKLQKTKSELEYCKKEKKILDEKISKIQTEKEMIHASFCRYIENTMQQQNEISQLKEKLQKLENSKNGFNRAQEIIESGEPLIYDRKSIIEGVIATMYPNEEENEYDIIQKNKATDPHPGNSMKFQSPTDKLQDLRVGFNNAEEGKNSYGILENEMTLKLIQTRLRNIQSNDGHAAVEDTLKNTNNALMAIQRLFRKQEQPHKCKGATGDIHPYDEKLLFTWVKLLNPCTQSSNLR